MTVKELRERLATYPDDLPIAEYFHSEYHEVTDLTGIVDLFDNGGYLSQPYRVEDRALAKMYLVLP